MRVIVFHFDMSDRKLAFDLSLNPQEAMVLWAWQQKRYDPAYMLNLSDGLSDADACEAAFELTQNDNPDRNGIVVLQRTDRPFAAGTRSTSVGDVVCLIRGDKMQTFVVSGFGFKQVDL